MDHLGIEIAKHTGIKVIPPLTTQFYWRVQAEKAWLAAVVILDKVKGDITLIQSRRPLCMLDC